MKEKKMTYSFFLSFPGWETMAGEEIETGEEGGIFSRLGRQLIEKGLKGEEIQQKSSD